ncbi:MULTISPECIES: flavin reductase family protein [Acinetobacter]|uniref:flavin reductase family protein n=1 Tax=Acinetobacter TaxID=469 RepID=UPI0013732BD2|nr:MULTISPECIES: flavin reductase family protein [Acinetobacter]MCU4571647.1 flavin reductase family protein [Acinetobacter ursingii]NAR18964.1 flavin reductase [Acinetobacter haemolyticus]NAR36344.1 flavin reductase [Acinetobacter haemolyticus]NAR62748.1 flavin reductase [Acinetobacter haemolyticus]NAS07421.1 flavin reductase [Acinetobacter haemolyticus]
MSRLSMQPNLVLNTQDIGLRLLASDLDGRKWRDTMANFASGVTIITSLDELGNAVGSTVSAFSSLSLDPMLLLVCLDNRSRTLGHIQRQENFAVNILSKDQKEMAFLCGSKSNDKFDCIEYVLGQYGLPLLKNTCVSIECELTAIHDGGDHKILIGKPLSLLQTDMQLPLIFHKGQFI